MYTVASANQRQMLKMERQHSIFFLQNKPDMTGEAAHIICQQSKNTGLWANE